MLVANGDLSAFAWRLRYDATGPAAAAAAHAFATIARALDHTLGPARIHTPTFACHERPDRGPLAVSRSSGDLIFILGPAHVAPSAWKSAGDCPLAQRWIHEIERAP